MEYTLKNGQSVKLLEIIVFIGEIRLKFLAVIGAMTLLRMINIFLCVNMNAMGVDPQIVMYKRR